MGKRSSFDRMPRDLYPTPREATAALLAHLSPGTRFVEPCAGDGALIGWLEAAGHVCVDAADIAPLGPYRTADATAERFAAAGYGAGDAVIITNPPWLRALLHALIRQLSDQAPTWLLFDADWAHTVQARPLLARLRRVVSVGRVKWMPGSKHTGKDNCAWHLFTRPSPELAVFYGRGMGPGRRMISTPTMRRAA